LPTGRKLWRSEKGYKIMDKKVTSDIKTSDSKIITKLVGKKKNRFFRWLNILIIIVVIILAVLGGIYKFTNWNVLGINKSEWQAVFLSNGQVYFGQITKNTKEIVILEDIYYLQVTKSLQPAESNVDQQNELSLVKLGNELHGPEDQMKINRAHILFIESLKGDGKVVRAIQKYLEETPVK